MDILNTMKKFITLILITLSSIFASQHVHAQKGDYEKIKAAMVSFYTEQMDMTSDQAAKFWPIHNEYESERRNINRQIKSLKKSGNPADLSKIESLEKRRFELRTQFKSRFLQVLSPAQLSKMYKAEEDFRAMMLDRMKD